MKSCFPISQTPILHVEFRTGNNFLLLLPSFLPKSYLTSLFIILYLNGKISLQNVDSIISILGRKSKFEPKFIRLFPHIKTKNLMNVWKCIHF
jgi:hypothetical protein